LENKDLAQAHEEKQAAEDGAAVAAAKKCVQPKACATIKAEKDSSLLKTMNKKRAASTSSSSAASASYNISASGMETSDGDVPKKHKRVSDTSSAKWHKMKPKSPSSNSDTSARMIPSIVRRRRAKIAHNQDMERMLNLQGGLLTLPRTTKTTETST